MKWLLLTLLTFIPWSSPSLMELAQEAFAKKEFHKAGRMYEAIGEKWPELRYPAGYNAAVCHLKIDSLQPSMAIFAGLSRATNVEIKSRALNNRAVYLAKEKKIGEAMELLKQALREYPENDLARYNLEILRKPPPNPPPPPPDPEQENQKQKQKQNKPSKPKPTEQLGNRSEEAVVSLQEAEKLLEEMNRREEQFLQQLRKKVKGKSERDGKPNW